ncbi:MAG: hypothetical protein E7605_05355 [Ruminococcaceae bacterium]|nr:hypothetical protein [Oscillospiraceae bacterium]
MPAKQKLYTIEVEKMLAECGQDTKLRYDMLKLVVAVQGLRNRDFPEIYLYWQESDYFWLDYMMKEGNFMHGMELVPVNTFDEFLSLYAEFIRSQGLALWEFAVPATMNVATTACGVDGYLPVRYDTEKNSIMNRVTAATGVEVKLDLVGKFTGRGIVPDTERPSTGSAKCDAYVWALEKYMDKTNPTLLVYMADGGGYRRGEPYYPDLGNLFVPNHDYAISKAAFVFDVSCWDDEAPWDDPDQPIGADFAIMQEVFMRQYKKTDGREMTTVGGFIPWHIKYTDAGGKGGHAGVDSEWRFTEVLSCYNCVKDADAAGYCGLANASAFTHFPLDEKYHNPRPEKVEEYDPNKTYVLFYVGDYDAGAWTAKHIPRWYKDPMLGKNPLMWCFNPNLSDRIPMAFDFIYKNYTKNDYFEAGDSGAGYNNPRLLYEPRPFSNLPDGHAVNDAHNKKYFDRFDIEIIGFIIDGHKPTTEQEMRDFSEYIIGGSMNNGPIETTIVNGAVYMRETCDAGVEKVDIDKCVNLMLHFVDHMPKEKKFHIFRTILVSPTDHDRLMEGLKAARPEANFTLVDPYNFFRMAKEAKEKGLAW